MLDDIKRTYDQLLSLHSHAMATGNAENILFITNHLIKLQLDIRQIHENCHLFKRELLKYGTNPLV